MHGPRAPNQSGPEKAKRELPGKKKIRMHGPRAPNQSGPEKAKRELPGKTNKSQCMDRERQIRAGPEKAKRELPGKTNKSECMDRERQIRAGPESAKPECSEKQKQINQNAWTESSKLEWPKKCKLKKKKIKMLGPRAPNRCGPEKAKLELPENQTNQNAWPKSAKSEWLRKCQTGMVPKRGTRMARKRRTGMPWTKNAKLKQPETLRTE